MDSYQPPPLLGWLGPWTHALIQEPIPKLGVAALAASMAQVQAVLWVPMAFALAAWSVDFAVGVLRSLSDPAVKLSSERAWKGITKGLVIPFLLLLAAILEGLTFHVAGWNPDGKLVLIVAVAIVWEEALSVQRNGKHFFRSLSFRLGSLPWVNAPKDGGEK